ncbi:MAG: DUF2384 domain-containing protein [Sphingomonas sp.]|nr:DUF2384 domain-containing protein [Sphingomonas sp.]
MATSLALDNIISASALARARAVSDGVAVAVIRDLVRTSSITVADLARVIGPRRTLDRRLKDGTPLSVDESDRFVRFAAVLDLATSIFGGRDAAMAWLRDAKRAFDGTAPLDLLRTDAGARAVEELLIRARHGMLA